MPQRLIASVAAGVLALVVVVGGVVLASSDGPFAIRIDDRSVSQDMIDDELAALAGNKQLQQLIAQSQSEPLSIGGASVTTATSSGWLGLRVGQELAAREVERRGIDITRDDRAKGRALAIQSVGGRAVMTSLPATFREAVAGRWANVAALQRVLLEDPTPELVEAARAACPSGRYVSHILVGSLLEAQAVERELDGGADFADLARSMSIDAGSASQGGSYGCLDEQSFVEPFQTVAATQPFGVVSDPVQTEFGFHLVLVEEPPRSVLEDAAIEAILGRARGARVEVNPRYGRWDRRNGQVVPPNAPAS